MGSLNVGVIITCLIICVVLVMSARVFQEGCIVLIQHIVKQYSHGDVSVKVDHFKSINIIVGDTASHSIICMPSPILLLFIVLFYFFN